MVNLQLDNFESKTSGSKRSALFVKLHHELRQRIVDGVYRKHVYLPSERALAKDFQTSRLTVSKALKALEQDNLVKRTPGRGTRVLPVTDNLSKPIITIVHGEFSGFEGGSRHDSWMTMQGARDVLDQRGYEYSLLAVPYPYDLSAQDLLDQAGAVLFIESCYGGNRIVSKLQSNDIPCVAAKLELDDVNVDGTWTDHRATMVQTVETFVMLGHKRIGFVGREADFASHGKAREGYIQGLLEAELPIDEALIAECEKSDGLSGYFAGRSLLSLEHPPTAIAVTRDSIAEGVCRAVQEVGLVVGRDVSIIGFDDTTWPEGREFLTTFREPCHEMGAAAAEMLIGRIINGSSDPQKRRFDAAFVLRKTAGPCLAP